MPATTAAAPAADHREDTNGVENVGAVKFTFTPAQRAVFDALECGASKADAARAANVHRDTVNRWEHNVPGFLGAVMDARNEYRQRLASQLRRVSVTALDQLEALLAGPETSPAVRLRAIQLVLTRPRFPDKEWALPENINPPAVQQLQEKFDFFEADYRAGLQEDHLRREQANTEKILSAAASESVNAAENVGFVGSQSASESSAPLINSSPEAGRRTTPSGVASLTARNASCPCGSGQKYKRCCGKSAPPHLHIGRAA